MFKKRKILGQGCVQIGNGFKYVDLDVAEHIEDLRKEIDELKFENKKLEQEIETIKPVLENPKLKPALTMRCHDCKFVVKSRWNGDILGCRRNTVCEDFIEREE